MRRSSLIAVATLSLVALISACATSPDDGLGDAVEEVKPAEPEPVGAKLPQKTTTETPVDSGVADSAKPDSGSSTSSSGSSGTSTSSSGSSGTSGTSGSSGTSSGGSSGTSSSGGVGPACNVNDPLKLILYQVQVSNQSAPVPCPCAATKCCYLGVTCINP